MIIQRKGKKKIGNNKRRKKIKYNKKKVQNKGECE